MNRARRIALVAALVAAFGYLHISARDGALSDTSTNENASGLHHPTGDGSDSIELLKPGEPCIGAQKISLAAADDLALSSKIPLPAFARDSVTETWRCAGDTPAFSFGATTMTLESGWSNVEPREKFSSLAATWGGKVTTINGVPALVEAPTQEGTKPHIMMLVGDTLVRLLGVPNGSIDAAVAVAEQLDLRAFGAPNGLDKLDLR
ncbi:hypothetical protein ACLM5J_20365 [Nocardioides sp. Bht2]|uniref:hypothetical protein n=1 Tax=Nocardioides sp. Bht2 TaxID=3392297 RepID=UPI0039B50CE1